MQPNFKTVNKFKDLGLQSSLLKAIDELGFVNPTPIQNKSIPIVLNSSRDLIALAQTGTGKTAAFGLPLIQQIELKNKNIQTIVLCPTRELCIQISNDLISYSKLINFVKDRPGHDFRYAINAEKIKMELDWVPTESFDSGIRKTVYWYLDNRSSVSYTHLTLPTN